MSYEFKGLINPPQYPPRYILSDYDLWTFIMTIACLRVQERVGLPGVQAILDTTGKRYQFGNAASILCKSILYVIHGMSPVLIGLLTYLQCDQRRICISISFSFHPRPELTPWLFRNPNHLDNPIIYVKTEHFTLCVKDNDTTKTANITIVVLQFYICTNICGFSTKPHFSQRKSASF